MQLKFVLYFSLQPSIKLDRNWSRSVRRNRLRLTLKTWFDTLTEFPPQMPSVHHSIGNRVIREGRIQQVLCEFIKSLFCPVKPVGHKNGSRCRCSGGHFLFIKVQNDGRYGQVVVSAGLALFLSLSLKLLSNMFFFRSWNAPRILGPRRCHDRGCR